MPHVIIEYTPDCVSDTQAMALCDVVFDAAVDSGLFAVENIKVRSIPVTAYRMGLRGEGFVCVQCRIHSGRTSTQKKALSEAIVAALRKLELDTAILTAEIVDMDQGSYSKYVTAD